MSQEQLRIVDSLRSWSDLDDASWQEVRKQVAERGLEGATRSARAQIATAMIKAQVSKGDYVGHPFRGNQWTDASGVSREGAGSMAGVMVRQGVAAIRGDYKRDREARAERRERAGAGRLANRPKAIKVGSIKEALALIQQGKVVELKDERKVNTLLKKLHKMANEASDRGEDVNFNLCNVSVAGTNLFCAESLADEEGKPLPRIKMPQLSGKVREGSEAAKVADEKGEADAGPAFLKFLRKGGIKVSEEKVPAASLKASQSELVGAKVAAIMKKGNWEKGTVYVSRDNYVIDGHHRWAAAVGADTEDGLGDLDIKVVRVDMPISEVLTVANEFTDDFGIKRKSA